MKQTLEIFTVFFKVGLFTFGGGYAMIPIVQKEVVDQKQWISEAQLLDFYGIAQVSPGIIAVNTNALIGYQIAKTKGALLAAIATVMPSILIITIIALFLEQFMAFGLINQMFVGIRIAVTALILKTAMGLMKKGVIDLLGLTLFVVSFVAITFIHVSPIFLIVPSALIGILFYPKRSKKS